MAQSKSSPSGKPGRPAGGGNRPGGKPGAARSGTSRPGAKTPGSTATSVSKAPGTPPRKKKPKSIVNQKQTPWGLIITTAVVVLFAIGVVGVVIATKKSDDTSATASKGGQSVLASDRYRQPELPAAAKITGVTYHVEALHDHTEGHVKYDVTPPIGGLHNGFWADCTGTVYSKAIANENAVHMLEHGAIWITYNAGQVKGAQLTKLKSYVSGINQLALSPYPGLKTPISLQAWGYQLKVDSASDPRIAQFISALKNNQKTTPEYGASCSNPGFKSHPSTFGHPIDS
jgi:hypothetical protein